MCWFVAGYFFVLAMTKVNPGVLFDFYFPGFIIVFTVPCKKKQPFPNKTSNTFLCFKY